MGQWLMGAVVQRRVCATMMDLNDNGETGGKKRIISWKVIVDQRRYTL